MKSILAILFSIILAIPIMAQTEYATTNDITLAYETFGKRNDQPLILINGLGEPMTNWPISFCGKLAQKGHFVIRFDNRDVGLSTKLDILGKPDWENIIPFVGKCEGAALPYSISDMASDVIGLMNHLNIEKAVVCGASMGAAIAQIIAISYPDRIEALVSIAAATGNPARPQGNPKVLQALGKPAPATKDRDSLVPYLVAKYKILGSTDDVSTLTKRAKAHLERNWYPEGTERQAAAIIIGDYCDRTTALSKLKLPSLIVHGEADPVIPVEVARQHQKAVPGAELLIVDGMGHDLSDQFIPELVENIDRFLSKE